MTNQSSTSNVASAWLRNNALASFIGMGLAHPFIAHSITGEHERTLTTPQFIMHSVSLIFFGTFLFFMQRQALKPKSEIRIFPTLLLFIVFIPVSFWTGYYVFYIPFDILLMYLSIGVLNGLSLKRYFPEQRLWVLKMIGAGFVAALAGIVIGIGSYFLFIKDLKGLVMHLTLWTFITLPAGTVYGWVGKRVMKKITPF